MANALDFGNINRNRCCTEGSCDGWEADSGIIIIFTGIGSDTSSKIQLGG
jgi:hypothetical protein